jgi:hypothetical protein
VVEASEATPEHIMEEEEEEEEQYEVEKICQKKTIARKVHYLVKFKDHEEKEWLPHENLSGCQELVDEYNRLLRVELDQVRMHSKKKKKKKISLIICLF